MSKDPANLEKALAKKARKQAKKDELRAKKARVSGFVAPEVLSVKGTENWTLSTCWIGSDWRNTNNLTQAIVTRTHANGRVAAAAFVVDLACLGVKNASVIAFISDYEFRTEYFDRLGRTGDFEVCSSDLIAKIVATGIDYARSLGFEPHPDTKGAMKFLHDAQSETVLDKVPTGGEDGRPLFIQGPYDNVKKVLKTLDKSVGEGNYGFVSAQDMFGDDDFDLDEDDFDDEDMAEILEGFDEKEIEDVAHLLNNLDSKELASLLEKALSDENLQDQKTIDVQAKKPE
jgi:hypothetical protein